MASMNITLHAYRSRWKTEPADDRYVLLKGRQGSVKTLSTPTLMIQGDPDMCDPPSESDGQDRYFTGGYRRAIARWSRTLSGARGFVASEGGRLIRIVFSQLF